MSPLMDRRQRHVTATGLFLLLSMALISVGARMGSLASNPADIRDRLELERKDYKAPPYFTLTDRDGTVLAWSIETYSVEASPFHLWLRHTPERIVEGLIEALDYVGEEQLEQREQLARDLLCLGEDDQVRVRRWPLLRDEATRIAEWVQQGGPGEGRPLPGIDVEHIADWLSADAIAALDAAGRGREVTDIERRRAAVVGDAPGPFYELVWQPQVLLSKATREAAIPRLVDRSGAASRWVHALSKELVDLLEGPRERERRYLRAKFDADPRPLEDRPVPRGYVLAGERIRRDGFLAGVRDLLIGPSAVPEEGDWLFVGPPREWVFDGLIPRRYVELVRELDVGRLDAVRKFLADEELSEYELALEPTARRDYPTGDHGVFGAWEWWQPTELGSLLLPEPSEEQQADDQAEQEPRVLRPTRGLENLGYLALLDVEEEFGDPRVADSAHWRTRSALWDDPPDQAYAPHLVAGSADRFERLLLRPRRPGEPRDYFMHRENGLDPAIVESTLDLDLQRRLGAALGDLLEEQQAALAMAVVLDLESREVLALDWAAKYASIAFPPLQHTFTPGSTFKLVTAGLALELGKVRADEVFDVGQGEYVVRDRRPSGRVRTRTVHEAEGYARGRITAAQCVARSSNAGMVQIGHRISVDHWKSMTGLLGYGTPAADGLIARGLSNAAGRVGELKRDSSDPWALTRSHTSVPFGDSVTTTLLQHAQSLAALTDDGVLRPLRFLRAWRVGERRFEFPAQAGQRVVSPAVSAELRAMMRLGAESGTGKNLERPEGLVLHTKTGTTEKLSSDVCAHTFWAEYAAYLEDPREDKPEWDNAARHAALRGKFRDGKSCYVSSICAIAPSPIDGRPKFVLVVVDDPHVHPHYGSSVAGPTAIRMLVDALGLEPDDSFQAQLAHSIEVHEHFDQPWDPRGAEAIVDGKWNAGSDG